MPICPGVGQFLFAYLAVHVAMRVSLGIPKKEHDALVAIYDNMNGESWRYSGSTKFVSIDFRKFEGWPIHDGKPCTWSGVECRNGHVTRLDLSFRGMDGDIPSEIGNLGHLKDLQLAYNNIRSLPPEIGWLEDLEELELRANRLTEIPSEIGNLSNLQVLNLAYNDLASLPPEIEKLKALDRLIITRYELNKMPAETRQIEALEVWR